MNRLCTAELRLGKATWRFLTFCPLNWSDKKKLGLGEKRRGEESKKEVSSQRCMKMLDHERKED